VAVESANFRFTNELVKLSEQHLIDANNLSNFGCDGGSSIEVIDYIIGNGGILRDQDYLYTGVQGPAKPITVCNSPL
jgi:cathepsin F